MNNTNSELTSKLFDILLEYNKAVLYCYNNYPYVAFPESELPYSINFVKDKLEEFLLVTKKKSMIKLIISSYELLYFFIPIDDFNDLKKISDFLHIKPDANEDEFDLKRLSALTGKMLENCMKYEKKSKELLVMAKKQIDTINLYEH